MLLILEEYFKEYPVKKRIVEGLYNHGISVVSGKFYLDKIELSVTEIANAFGVNRRTVYETLKLIENKEEIRQVMGKISPDVNISKVAPFMGNQVVTIYTTMGFFSKVFGEFIDTVRKYGCYMREVSGRNLGKDETFVRAIFYRPIPERIFTEIGKIEGIVKIIINTPEEIDGDLICNKCEVRICPNKLSTGITDSEYY